MNEQLTINARTASETIMGDVQRLNAGRRMPRLTRHQKAEIEENKVYIFNVSPFSFSRHMGSTGTFLIPACPVDREVSAPVVIPGVVYEPIIVDENQMAYQADDGDYVAEQIIGVGPFMRPQDALPHIGVFLDTTPVPSAANIAAAREKLKLHFERLVSEMNNAVSMGPMKRQEVEMPEHHVAARYLKKTKAECPWMETTVGSVERNTCPGCGGIYIVGIQKCSNGNCGYILDKTAYEKSVMDGDYGETARAQLLERKKKPIQVT